jgi:hypothetical protein
VIETCVCWYNFSISTTDNADVTHQDNREEKEIYGRTPGPMTGAENGKPLTDEVNESGNDQSIR